MNKLIIIPWIQSSCILTCSLLASMPTAAQVTADGTTSTTVTSPDGSNFTINNGDRAGANLFHSFQDFSVPTNGSASFNNAVDIQNIFSRVTGGKISNIDGLIKANGSANLFLINPVGIIFGKNARLDIGGSFYGSTADSISFPDGVEFDANNLQAPVLTINAPIGLNFRDNPGEIIVQGNGNGARLGEDLVNNQDGLQVNFDQTLALIGGNLTLEGATLITRGGTIELGSVEGNEQVRFTSLDGNLSPDYQDVSNFRDLTIFQRTTVNTSSVMGGGRVQLQGKNITFNEQSAILSDTLGDANGKGVYIQASETLQLLEGAFISTSTNGKGDAGNLNIQARQEIRLTGKDPSNLIVFFDSESLQSAISEASLAEIRENGGLFAASVAGGKTGEISIETEKLLLANGFVVTNSTIDGGDLGSILKIRASDSVKIINSALFSTTINDSQEAGDIKVHTNKLNLEGVGGILTSTLFDSGNAGQININAADSVELDGSTSNDSSLPKGILSNSVDSDGDAGNILIETSKLLVEQAQITSTSGGSGRGGDIEIKASNSVQLIGSGLENLVENEALLLSGNLNPSNLQQAFGIIAGTDGSGNSGQIAVNSPSVSLREGAVISSIAFPNSTGAAGDISIFNADNLRVKDSRISSSTLGNGNGGKIKLNTSESIQIINSAISSNSLFREGKAGDINITTGRVTLDSGLVITASGAITPEMIITRGGTGGNIDIKAKESIELIGNQPNDTALVASTFTDSSAGDVTITTNKLIVRDGADITVSSGISENAALGGDAGTLKITANSLNLDNQAQISATTNSGDGGNIILELDDNLVISSDSRISAEAFENANGGNIDIDAQFIIASPSQNGGNDIIASAEEGKGGDINITAEALFGIEARELSDLTNDINASSQFNQDGNINLSILDVDLTQGVTELPKNLIEPETIVAQDCSYGGGNAKSNLAIQGRGGISPELTAPLTSDSITIEGENLTAEAEQDRERNIVTLVESERPLFMDEIVPARGAIILENGDVILTAYPTSNSTSRNPTNSSICSIFPSTKRYRGHRD